MYFKNDYGKVYIENGTLFVDSEVCTITIKPKQNIPHSFLEEEYEFEVAKLQMAQIVLPPKHRF